MLACDELELSVVRAAIYIVYSRRVFNIRVSQQRRASQQQADIFALTSRRAVIMVIYKFNTLRRKSVGGEAVKFGSAILHLATRVTINRKTGCESRSNHDLYAAVRPVYIRFFQIGCELRSAGTYILYNSVIRDTG